MFLELKHLGQRVISLPFSYTKILGSSLPYTEYDAIYIISLSLLFEFEKLMAVEVFPEVCSGLYHIHPLSSDRSVARELAISRV